MKYIKGLDTLGAFAVMFVIIYHWGLPIPNGAVKHFLQALIPDGLFGVTLFFVLSGFLITSILLDARTAAKSKLHVIRNFIIRRVLRIFPIYYLTIFVLTLIGYPSVRENLEWLLSYTSNILVFRNHSWNPFSHTWSLSVEEQFYLIWPWCIVFVAEKYLKYIFIAALLTGVISIIFVSKIDPDTWGLMLTPTCLASFGIGGFYAWVSREPWSRKRFMQVITLLMPIAIGLHFYWSFCTNGGHFNYLNRIIQSIISIWLIHKTVVVRPGWVKTKILENPTFIKMGQISYGIYLYHYVTPWIYSRVVAGHFSGTPATQAFFSNYYISWFLMLAFVLALSLASFYLFESPIVNLKKWFAYTRQSKPMVTIPDNRPVNRIQPVLSSQLEEVAQPVE
jgi:peptidoglycan/LPS O-acetylase OafA/YrhL